MATMSLVAALLTRRAGEQRWSEVADGTRSATIAGAAHFTVAELGEYEYTIEAWVDRFETWRHELSKKFGAGQDVSSELLEGAAIVRRIAREPMAACSRRRPRRWRMRPGRSRRAWRGHCRAAAQRDGAAAGSAAWPPATTASLKVTVERVRARFGAWYEMFPRSAGTDPRRSATFGEAARLLPYISSLGFDVLYLPPIHPIGRSFRKGRNNALEAGPDDPGSPWAIGSDEGGHDAIEPGLGTIDDFDRFVEAARSHDLEIALDLAYQASPDHPYVREHPEWFRQRPDGTIKYAENPPKKYQDIYPINFESEEWQSLWVELKRIIEFWVGHGVKIFRVDNPHTKPYRFWEWALADIRTRHPDTIFLSEAFTPAEGDALPGEVRLLTVVHVFHVAEYERGAHRILRRSSPRRTYANTSAPICSRIRRISCTSTCSTAVVQRFRCV